MPRTHSRDRLNPAEKQPSRETCAYKDRIRGSVQAYHNRGCIYCIPNADGWRVRNSFQKRLIPGSQYALLQMGEPLRKASKVEQKDPRDEMVSLV
ncbi:hypothetical protein WJX84_002701 [Apatococcus fuscideae]|uniref:Uncharacterized protein n=1 Tax=Apatococcus fuscideae TaxID=2026836 RepID=A0AAW1TA56_9CHLO